MVSTTVEEATVLIESVNEDRYHFVRPDPHSRVLLIADDGADSLCAELSDSGYNCVISPYSDVLFEALEENMVEILVIDMESLPMSIPEGFSFARKLKTRLEVPAIALIPNVYVNNFDVTIGIDDFMVKPCKSDELSVRIRQILWRTSNIENGNIVKQGDLLINMDKYEVSIAGKLIPLSFKEYELLKVLVTNKDRVLTREALLDKVWGYDYFGGDRTVDVHIRRLRSKIEDADHTFIDTVRNVGYKFKDD